MIDGLKITVSGKELIELCRAHAQRLRQKAEAIQLQVTALGEVIAENPNTSSDPKRDLRNKVTVIQGDSQELEFIASHITPDESYLLDRADLIKLGIARAVW